MAEARAEILVLAGEGIGPEVTGEAVRVLQWFIARRGLACTVSHADYGAVAYRKSGRVLPDETLARILAADAVLLGAHGGPELDAVPKEERDGGSLLQVRKAMGVYANLRPVKAFPELLDASTLKPEAIRDVDLVIVRELMGGIYFGEPRGIETLPDGGRRGFNTQSYATDEIRRIGRVAFELARSRRGKVCSVEKGNVLESGLVWREEMQRLHDEDYPDVELRQMFSDNCAMQLVRDPRQFDVIVMDNYLGDILSDCAAMISASLGMLPSAALGAPGPDGRRPALYEPIHGSAPDIAGKGVANPLATILSVALMLRHSFARPDDADLLEQAVRRALAAGVRTGDIAGGLTPVGTVAMGDAVLAALDALSSERMREAG